MLFWGLLFGSFFLVALGQSAWIPGLGAGAAAFGFALFWCAMLTLPRRRDRMLLSFIWFAAVQAIQLSWLTSTQYMGPLILIVYILLILALGAQFSLLSFFFSPKGISLSAVFAGAGCWVLMEWVRLYPLSGFTWNPVGLALADSPLSIQFASLFGVYGLSFWVIFVNLFAIYAKTSWKKGAAWMALSLFPYFFGWAHQTWIENNIPGEKNLSVALVQTAILPEEKDYLPHRSDTFVPPLDQWGRICQLLQRKSHLDLIVLPESVVSMGAYHPFYPMDLVTDFWVDQFGGESLADLPPLAPPFAIMEQDRGEKRWRVTNAFLAQGLANHFNAHLIAGFDDRDVHQKYNAAFYFQPHSGPPQRSEKRVLVPIGEYIPFSSAGWFSRFLVDQFGVGDSFSAGTEAKVFLSSFPVGVSICLEETYSGLIRDLRNRGARLLINITNDVWFPASRLPQQHFQHGRIRAAENGAYVLRSCNTGITGGVNCFGGIIASLPSKELEMGVLYLNFPLRSFATLYTWWGDGAILIVSACFLFFWLWKKKLLLNASLR